MVKLSRKFKSRRGESLVEILIAILIVAFGCMLVATMYSSAMSLNIKASEEDDAFYKAISDMEQMWEGDSTKKTEGDVFIKDQDGKEYRQGVDIFGDGAYVSYKR